MDLENLEIQIEENVLKFLLQREFKKDIEDAREYFYGNLGDIETNDKMMIDFNSWLIYDYRMKDGKSFIKKYYETMEKQLSKEEGKFIHKKIESYLSLYEIKEIKENKGLLKDVFAKTEFWINLDQIEEIKRRDLILGRIIEISNEYKLVGDSIYIPAMFKNAIERNMVTQYQEYKGKKQYATWEEFLKKNSLLLQKYIGIIADVTHQTEDEDAYNVWQSIYLIDDIKVIKQKLQKFEKIEMDFEENGNCYLKLFDEEELLAEIVLQNNKIELECTSEKDRIKAKKLIESMLEDLIKHYKDEIVGLDDLV